MSAFGGLLLTNRGRNLQSKAQTGIQLQYTRIALGDGALGSTPIADLNALNNQKKSLSVSKLRILSGGRAVIGSTLSNQDMNEGFYFREIGVFAQDPDIGEILYCYANAGTLAEYIPPAGGADVIEKSIDVQTLIGNAQNISAVIDNSLVFASEADLTLLRDQIEGDIGDLLLLETDEKGSIVAAVNEIEQKRKTHSAETTSERIVISGPNLNDVSTTVFTLSNGKMPKLIEFYGFSNTSLSLQSLSQGTWAEIGQQEGAISHFSNNERTISNNYHVLLGDDKTNYFRAVVTSVSLNEIQIVWTKVGAPVDTISFTVQAVVQYHG